jgi:hypothetical protein
MGKDDAREGAFRAPARIVSAIGDVLRAREGPQSSAAPKPDFRSASLGGAPYLPKNSELPLTQELAQEEGAVAVRRDARPGRMWVTAAGPTVSSIPPSLSDVVWRVRHRGAYALPKAHLYGRWLGPLWPLGATSGERAAGQGLSERRHVGQPSAGAWDGSSCLDRPAAFSGAVVQEGWPRRSGRISRAEAMS